MPDTSFLLQHSWKNIWKEKKLWMFSGLLVIEPLVRSITSVQKSADLVSSFINLTLSTLAFISYAGITYISYCVIEGKPVIIREAFQVAMKSFCRVIGSSLLLLLFVAPFLCLVLIFSIRQPLQASDVAHNFFFASMVLSFLTALWYLVLAEIVIQDSAVRNSVKNAWTIFTKHFAILAVIGIFMMSIWHVANAAVGTAVMLIQHNFDLTALHNLDLLSPHLSFTNNNWYGLANAMVQAVWLTYSIFVFVLAYLMYRDAKNNPRRIP